VFTFILGPENAGVSAVFGGFSAESNTGYSQQRPHWNTGNGYGTTTARKAESKNEALRRELVAQTESFRAENESLNREAQGLVLRERERLFQLYPNLKKYVSGNNDVNDRYIEGFSIQRGYLPSDSSKIVVRLRNNTGAAIGPDAQIAFLNREGFVTGTYRLLWVFARIKPLERRVDEGTVGFDFGELVYYTIRFGK
jgi:hypothetical protein